MIIDRRKNILNRLEDNQNAFSDSFVGTISPKEATLSARDKRRRMFVGATGREYETREHRAAVEPSTETQEENNDERHPFSGLLNLQTTTEWAPPKPPVNPNGNEPYDEMYNQYYNVATGKPMDIAFQLLKDDDKNATMDDAFDLGQPLFSYDELHDKQKQIVDTIADAPPSYWNDPASGELETENYAEMFSPETHHHFPDKAFDEYLRYIQHFHDASSKVNELPHEEQMKIMNHRANSQHSLPHGERQEHPLHPAKVALDKMAEENEHWGGDYPHKIFRTRYQYDDNQALSNLISEDDKFSGFPEDFVNANKSEPMDIAFQLLKERKSPAAFAHKLEYDKQYQKDPKRVKYREQLNTERRKRGIYGKGGKDVSHTQGGKLTLESAHSNRARHFKNRGTLRRVKVKK